MCLLGQGVRGAWHFALVRMDENRVCDPRQGDYS